MLKWRGERARLGAGCSMINTTENAAVLSLE